MKNSLCEKAKGVRLYKVKPPEYRVVDYFIIPLFTKTSASKASRVGDNVSPRAFSSTPADDNASFAVSRETEKKLTRLFSNV